MVIKNINEFHKAFNNAHKDLIKDPDVKQRLLTSHNRQKIIDKLWLDTYNVKITRDFGWGNAKYATFESEQHYMLFLIKWL